MTESLMRRALDVAREGMDAGEAPIGCVLARGDGVGRRRRLTTR